MADKKTTLFEFHMHGNPQFGPKVFGSSNETDEEEREMGTETDEEMGADESSGGSRIPKLVMALIALAVISFGVRKLKGMGSGDGGEAIDVETDDLTASA